MFMCVLGCYAASTVCYQYPNLPEGADQFGQMGGDKERVTNYGRVWKKGARKRGMECALTKYHLSFLGTFPWFSG